ncbi:hypothetical protein CDD83_7289 [Cordyceps sp. RAO-2017]|nr:hypothetical protein CDD83_7289 [Cordyceps sp. RAO-2017]
MENDDDIDDDADDDFFLRLLFPRNAAGIPILAWPPGNGVRHRPRHALSLDWPGHPTARLGAARHGGESPYVHTNVLHVWMYAYVCTGRAEPSSPPPASQATSAKGPPGPALSTLYDTQTAYRHDAVGAKPWAPPNACLAPFARSGLVFSRPALHELPG